MTSGYKDGTPEEVRMTPILPQKSFIFLCQCVEVESFVQQTLVELATYYSNKFFVVYQHLKAAGTYN